VKLSQKPSKKAPSAAPEPSKPPKAPKARPKAPEPPEGQDEATEATGAVSSNVPEGLSAPPGWLVGGGGDGEGGGPAEPEGDNEEARLSAGRILFCAVDLAHDKAAQYTHWPGWVLDDKEVALWKELCAYIARFIPFKDMPIVIVGVAILMAEMAKVAGFMDWRKSLAPPPDTPERKLKKDAKEAAGGKREPSTR